MTDTAKPLAPRPGSDGINWAGTDPLPRDMEQSRRLHEPDHLTTNIDPITGRDVGDLTGKPFYVDGNVTMYFENEATRQAYLDEPLDHPFPLVDNPNEEGIDEG